MYRYVATETGEMLRCEQGAWVKHDDCVILQNQINFYEKSNEILSKQMMRLSKQLNQARELSAEKSLLIEELEKRLEDDE